MNTARLNGFKSAIVANGGVLHLPRNDEAGDKLVDEGYVVAQDCNDGSVIYILAKGEDEHGY